MSPRRYTVPGGQVRRIGLDPEHEVGTRQDVLQRRLNAGLEGSTAPRRLVEPQCVLDVGIGRRPAIRVPRQRRDDPAGAPRFVGTRRRPAHEDAAAARRIAGAGRIQRTGDREHLDVGTAGPVERVVRAAQVRLQPDAIDTGQRLDKRHAHRVRAGLDGDAETQARFHRVAGRRRFLERRREIGLAADGRDVHPLPVNRVLDLVGILQAAHHAQVGAHQRRLEDVLAVERKRMARERAADGPQRQTFDVLVLRQILPHAIGAGARRLLPGRRSPAR